MLPVKYELRYWGNHATGEYHYAIDGVEVTKTEYYLAWKENNEHTL
jgi:hypothetical protein